MSFTWTIIVLVVVLVIAWRYLGSYTAAVFDGRMRWLAFTERPVYTGSCASIPNPSSSATRAGGSW